MSFGGKILTRICRSPTRYPDAKDGLLKWYKITKGSNWGNFNQMKNSFNSVDAVGNDLYVFNIKGNEYRLIARIFFKIRTV
ncbi:MAG: type II toxin-antitoxin system HigB family toxin, partial [Bacteroidota bacterium]|nr:type II toxin-antitoxin system HigB family toxin [Bacteroidota bacterium]